MWLSFFHLLSRFLRYYVITSQNTCQAFLKNFFAF
nr:MAG TPA: hypothetical protein [Caudoviricetes sp.]